MLATLRAARAGLHDPVRRTFCDRCGQVSGCGPGCRLAAARSRTLISLPPHV